MSAPRKTYQARAFSYEGVDVPVWDVDYGPEGDDTERFSVLEDLTEANARLIAETMAVRDETGLTPRRLADDRSNALRMMGDESLLRSELISSLTEIVEYEGGAVNAMEDEYVMDRARRILAKAREGWA